MDAWQIPSEQFYFYIFVNCSYFISFLFFVCELFIISFFLLFNLCGFFFFAILCFCCLFVFFVILCLVFCWFWGTGLTVSFALLFIVICLFFFLNLFLFYFFLFLFLFFYLHGFSGFIFCKFNCSWHFFTSSDRVSPEGGAREPRFADWYRGVVSYTNDDFGKWVAWLTWNWWNGTEETVDDGLGRRYLGAGRCPVAPPPWLVMAGRSGRWCQLLCFFLFFFFLLIFWKSMVINGWETCFVCCRGQWRPPGWEVNSTVLSGTLFLLRHRSNCGDYWCSRVVRKGGRQVQKYSWIVG